MMVFRADDEAGRICALERTELLDTARDDRFDAITRLVRTVLSVPVAAVSLIDRDRQWFKSIDGLEVTETPRDISFCTHTIQREDGLVVPDALLDPLFAATPLVTEAPFIRSYLGAPILTPDGYAIGSLCVVDMEPRSFTSKDVEILKGFARLVSDQVELRHIAGTDALTGLATRRRLIAELEAVHQGARTASLVLIDLDGFKAINDTHGHPFGDQILVEVGRVLKRHERPDWLAARMGGDEFAMLMPGISVPAAIAAAEAIRRDLAALWEAADHGIEIRASFGVAAKGGDRPGGWIERADRALYEAKRTGRDCVRCDAPALSA